MSQTPPTAPDPLPPAPSTANPTSFDSRADAFLGVLQTWATQLTALATNAYNNAVDAFNNAVAAAASAVTADASKTAAAASAISAGMNAGATAWNAATNYATGVRAIDPNQFVYYRLSPGGVDASTPSSAPTKWAPIPFGFVDLPVTTGSTATAQVGTNVQLRNAAAAMTVSIPAGLANGARFRVSPENGRFDNVLSLGTYLLKGPTQKVLDTQCLLTRSASMELVYDLPNNTLIWE